jgi:hypothetical protein
VSSLDREVSALDGVELATLRLGAYELKEHLEIPYRVVLDEAIELAKHFGGADSHKYINGVLDRLATTLRAADNPCFKPRCTLWRRSGSSSISKCAMNICLMAVDSVCAMN